MDFLTTTAAASATGLLVVPESFFFICLVPSRLVRVSESNSLIINKCTIHTGDLSDTVDEAYSYP